MSNLKTKLKIESTSLLFFGFMTVISLPVILILILAALFFGLSWAWVGGGLIAAIVLFIATLVSGIVKVVVLSREPQKTVRNLRR